MTPNDFPMIVPLPSPREGGYGDGGDRGIIFVTAKGRDYFIKTSARKRSRTPNPRRRCQSCSVRHCQTTSTARNALGTNRSASEHVAGADHDGVHLKFDIRVQQIEH